ncbi:hypothetical protein [Amycolatopsis sp. cmx-4-54]|uniref:hypothetical protein n=1 Tax=Amycolatopsis sp. cmx-4-54 TaxID=2790936 RepID=UPI00397C11F9
MSKPRGYYYDRMLGRLPAKGPFTDWLVSTVLYLVLASVLLWIVSIVPIAWVTGNLPALRGGWGDGLGWLYLAAVLIWVIPASAWSGFRIYQNRHKTDYSRR